MREAFALDPVNGKAMGVCAGVARSAGLDPLVVRVAALLSLLALGPLTIVAYLATGLIAGRR